MLSNPLLVRFFQSYTISRRGAAALAFSGAVLLSDAIVGYLGSIFCNFPIRKQKSCVLFYAQRELKADLCDMLARKDQCLPARRLGLPACRNSRAAFSHIIAEQSRFFLVWPHRFCKVFGFALSFLLLDIGCPLEWDEREYLPRSFWGPDPEAVNMKVRLK